MTYVTHNYASAVLSVSHLFIFSKTSFSTSSAHQRSFEIWSALAKKAGFTPEEVLDAATLGSYVVVDPMNKTALLALSPMAYQKLLGQVLSREDSSLILLYSPFDSKSQTNNLENTPNTPPPISTLVIENVESMLAAIKRGKLATRAQPYYTESLFAYQGLGVKLVSGRLSFESPAEFLKVLQRWLTRLGFWVGLSRMKNFRTDIYFVLRHLVRIIEHRGPYGLALYLKASYRVVLSFLSGTRVSHCFTFAGVPVRLANGLPAFLPRRWRSGIRSGSSNLIRVILSLLYIYKSIHSTSKKAKDPYGTVVLPAINPLTPNSPFRFFTKEFLAARVKPISFGKLVPTTLPLSLRAGPTSPLATINYGADAYAWVQREEGNQFYQQGTAHVFDWLKLIEADDWIEMIRLWAQHYCEGRYDTSYSLTLPAITTPAYNKAKRWVARGMAGIMNILSNVSYMDTRSKRDFMVQPLAYAIAQALEGEDIPIPVGRLHCIFEACGKTRVIAIFDGIRQSLLKPFHTELFKIITKLFGNCSAIFDQSGSVNSFALQKFQNVYSFDISAATDSISRDLYLPMLEYLIGPDLAKTWLGLMTDHDFIRYSKDATSLFDKIRDGSNLKYGRGQPMGGYSSFGCLDLLHHLLVQYSAYLSDKVNLRSKNIFSDYRILGDDVVIGCPIVARAYLDTCREFDIPISISKSFLSTHGFFSFVSQNFRDGVNLSPMSLLSDYSSHNLLTRLSMALIGVQRGYGSLLPTQLTSSLLRLVCNKDQYRFEMERKESNKVSSTLMQVAQFLSCNVQTFEGWTISHWIRNAVTQQTSSTLRAETTDISQLQQNFVFTVLRELLFKRIKVLQRIYHREFPLLEEWIVDEDGEGYYYSFIENHMESIGNIAVDMTIHLKLAKITPEWCDKAFHLMVDSAMITPQLTAIENERPLDWVVHMFYTQLRKENSWLEQIALRQGSILEKGSVLLSEILLLVSTGDYHRNILNGITHPYAPTIVGDTLGKSTGCP